MRSFALVLPLHHFLSFVGILGGYFTLVISLPADYGPFTSAKQEGEGRKSRKWKTFAFNSQFPGNTFRIGSVKIFSHSLMKLAREVLLQMDGTRRRLIYSSFLIIFMFAVKHLRNSFTLFRVCNNISQRYSSNVCDAPEKKQVCIENSAHKDFRTVCFTHTYWTIEIHFSSHA